LVLELRPTTKAGHRGQCDGDGATDVLALSPLAPSIKRRVTAAISFITAPERH
jgi:hypothetical protein